LSAVQNLAALNGEVTRQAATIAFLNDFWLIMVMTLLSIPMLLLLKPVKMIPASGLATVEH